MHKAAQASLPAESRRERRTWLVCTWQAEASVAPAGLSVLAGHTISTLVPLVQYRPALHRVTATLGWPK